MTFLLRRFDKELEAQQNCQGQGYGDYEVTLVGHADRFIDFPDVLVLCRWNDEEWERGRIRGGPRDGSALAGAGLTNRP